MYITFKYWDHNYKCTSYTVSYFKCMSYPKGLDHGNKCASYDNMAQHIQEISKHMPKPTAPPQPSNTRECLTL